MYEEREKTDKPIKDKKEDERTENKLRICAFVGLWTPDGTGSGSGAHSRSGPSPDFRAGSVPES
ncbi:unnamed protein product, partial [Rotaria sp. Silwood1]